MKRVCVFCGSSKGASEKYAEAARRCGTTLAARGFGLVYGGGNIGLMGVMADAVLAGGGQVIGVIPQKLIDRELAHRGVTSLIAVETMHERKRQMADRSDAFVALPGGIGTMEEFFEVFTWLQLGFHDKPVGLLNVGGFYNALIEFLAHMQRENFLKRAHFERLHVATDIDVLLGRLWTVQTDRVNDE